MSKKMPMFYSALLLTCVNLLLRVVSTSFQVYISGRLGAAGVGLLQLVLSVGGLAMTAGIAGVRTATMYLTAEELGKKRPGNLRWVLRGCFGYSIACSGAVAIGLFMGAPMIARHWIGDIRTVESIRTFGVFLPVVCLSGCMTGYFTAENRIGTLAAVEIAEQFFSMAVTMTALAFWAGKDPGRACQSVVMGSGCGAVLTLTSLMFLRRRYPAPGNRISIRSRLLGTAVPLALADDLKAGISTTENLMVPKRLALYPGTASPLAAFGMVCGMVFPILMFPAAILFSLAELLIPELARCAATDSRRRIDYLARRSLRIAMIYGCFCGGLLYLLSQPLCVSLYQSHEASQYLKLYAFLAPMLYCDAITDAMIKGLGQQRVSVRYNILTSTMDVVFLFLLLPRYGMMGYFFSFLVTHLVNFVLSLRRLIRITELKVPFYIPALTCAATLFAAFGASFVQNVPLQVGAYFALMGSLLTLFRVLSKEDLFWVKGLIRKN